MVLILYATTICFRVGMIMIILLLSFIIYYYYYYVSFHRFTSLTRDDDVAAPVQDEALDGLGLNFPSFIANFPLLIIIIIIIIIILVLLFACLFKVFAERKAWQWWEPICRKRVVNKRLRILEVKGYIMKYAQEESLILIGCMHRLFSYSIGSLSPLFFVVVVVGVLKLYPCPSSSSGLNVTAAFLFLQRMRKTMRMPASHQLSRSIIDTYLSKEIQQKAGWELLEQEREKKKSPFPFQTYIIALTLPLSIEKTTEVYLPWSISPHRHIEEKAKENNDSNNNKKDKKKINHPATQPGRTQLSQRTTSFLTAVSSASAFVFFPVAYLFVAFVQRLLDTTMSMCVTAAPRARSRRKVRRGSATKRPDGVPQVLFAGVQDRYAKERAVANKKQELTLTEICDGCTASVLRMLSWARTAEFDADPPYDSFRGVLLADLEEAGETCDNKFEWEPEMAPLKAKHMRIRVRPGIRFFLPRETTKEASSSSSLYLVYLFEIRRERRRTDEKNGAEERKSFNS
eukprot:gene10560-7332_t